MDSSLIRQQFLDRLALYRDTSLRHLLECIPDREPKKYLYELVTVYPNRSGKGFRPSLCLSTCKIFGGSENDAMNSAIALELYHNAFLVHDDIEDESEERRGFPTLHAEYGVPIAINVGDAMNVLGIKPLMKNGGNGKDERPVGEICASGTYVEINGKRNQSYCTPASVKRTFHGDQWVTAEIEIRDGKITHFVNGEEILQFQNPRYDPNHPIAKNFIVNGNDAVKEGYISLQSNSHPMDFRKIEIMEY